MDGQDVNFTAWKLEKAEDHLQMATMLVHNAKRVSLRGDNDEYVKDNVNQANEHVRMATILLTELLTWE